MLQILQASLQQYMTVNFLMFQLVLEKAEEPEINLPTSAGSSKKQEFQKNIYFCFVEYAKAFDCVDHNKLWKILKEMGIPDHLTCVLRNLYENNGNPLQYSCLENPMDRGAWWATVHGVTKSWPRLSDFTFNAYI